MATIYYRCGQSSNAGQRDTFSTTIKILDENNNVLSIKCLTRNNDVSIIDNNSHIYRYSNIYRYRPQKLVLGMANVDNVQLSINQVLLPLTFTSCASLTATLLDIDYTPIAEETQARIRFNK